MSDDVRYEYTRPWLYPKQYNAFYNESRYSVIEASTKAGKTVAGIAWLFEQALGGKDGWNYWWVAPTSTVSEIAFNRLCLSIPRSIYTANKTKMTMKLYNGATIFFKSADKPNSLFGEDVMAALLDEASRMKEDSWIAVRSTITKTRGPIRMIGNVKGKSNFFYKLCREAQSGKKNWEYHKINAYDAVEAGVLDIEEIEDAKEALTENVFKELYMAEAADDGGNPFGIDSIAACVVDGISKKKPLAWGWDLAKSYDWTVGIAFDEDGRVCRFHRFQREWGETMERILIAVGAVGECKTILIDSTGVGDPIVEQLTAKNKYIEGFKFSSRSKQQLMEGLSLSIQRREIGFPNNEIVNELDLFEYEYTQVGGVKYSAPAGYHDDCVCALALANLNFIKPKRESFVFV